MRPAMPMKDAAERYSPEMAAAFTGGETSRAATMKSAGVRAIRMPRAPTTTVSSTTTAMAATETNSVIGVIGRSVDPVREAHETLLQAASLIVVEDPDDQDDRVDAGAECHQRERQPENLDPVQSRQDRAQDRQRGGHGEREGQADQRQAELSPDQRPD